MKPSEMFAVATTAMVLVAGLRFAPSPAAEVAVVATFCVCSVIYVAYRWLQVR